MKSLHSASFPVGPIRAGVTFWRRPHLQPRRLDPSAWNADSHYVTFETVNTVNQCQIREMQKAARTLDPLAPDSCMQFSQHVRNVQAAIIHTYQIVAHAAIREADPASAAKLWKEMSDLCDTALAALKELKSLYPTCGTSELYDLALDYKSAAWRRYTENLEDAECPPNLLPNSLFPQPS